MAVNPVTTFIDALRDLQLLVPKQLEEIKRWSTNNTPEPKVLAKQLLDRKWLTSFQVNHLLKGRPKELVIGSYVLLEPLGEGGMGQVFKAHHLPTNRIVALKVMRKEQLANLDLVRRFYQEIALTSQIKHPNVVMAYDAGQAAQTHYFAMEYVEGSDFTKLVRDSGPLPVWQACEFVRQAALGLQAAHEQGLIHRDIKPGNLIVNQFNGTSTVKILDLGLARLRDQDNGLTRVGAVLGTPNYLSPEQAKNSSGVDIRSDLYSLGCTFFHLLTAKPPFIAESVPEILYKHMAVEPPPLADFRSDVPAGVQAIMTKLLAKNPADRFQAPALLVAALEPFAKKGNEAYRRAEKAGPASVLSDLPDIKKKGLKPASIPSSRRSLRRSQGGSRVFVAALMVAVVGLTALGGGIFALSYLPKMQKEATHAEVAEGAVPTKAKPATKAEGKPVTKPEETKVPVQPKAEEKKPPDKPKPEETKPPDKPKPEVTKPPDKPKPEEKPPLEPEKLLPVGQKQAIPVGVKLAQAEKRVQDSFRFDFERKKPSELKSLALRLFEEAKKTKPDADDSAFRFALLREARNVAIQASDIDTAYAVIDEMKKRFDVEVFEQKAQALEHGTESGWVTTTFVKTVATEALSLSEQAVDEDRYEPAMRFLKIATTASRKAGDASLMSRSQVRTRQVGEITKAYPEAKTAADKLKDNPNDADAALKRGRFVCFLKDDWIQGLPLLAKCSEPTLKLLSGREVAQPTLGKDQFALADGWANVANGLRGLAKKHTLLHAKQWYLQAAPALSEVQRGLANKRVKEIDAQVTEEDANTTQLPSTTTVAKEAPEIKEKPKSSGRVFTKTEMYDKFMQAGQAALEAGKHSEATQNFIEALTWAPKDAKAMSALRDSRYTQHMSTGRAAMAAKKYAEAAREFELALREMPKDTAAGEELKQAKELLGK